MFVLLKLSYFMAHWALTPTDRITLIPQQFRQLD